MTEYELDILIAEKVFSAHRSADGWWEVPGGELSPFPTIYATLPHFSTSIADAWLVVEAMRRRWFWVSIDIDNPKMMHGQTPTNTEWGVFFYHDTDPGEGRARDASAPRAIALAALAALGVEVQP